MPGMDEGHGHIVVFMAFAALHREQLQAGVFLALMLCDARLDHEAETAQEFIDAKPGADLRQRLQAGQALAQLLPADGGLGKNCCSSGWRHSCPASAHCSAGRASKRAAAESGAIWTARKRRMALCRPISSAAMRSVSDSGGASPNALMSNRPLASRSRSGGLAWRT